MSAKSNEMELSEEFIVMWKEEQPPEVFCKIVVSRNFANFTGKHLCQSLFFNKGKPREISKNTFSYRTSAGDSFQSLINCRINFRFFQTDISE